ncbi:MAG: sensor protein [Frankiales bacterium]|nr:sensor protein [Frankiales bacterium]
MTSPDPWQRATDVVRHRAQVTLPPQPRNVAAARAFVRDHVAVADADRQDDLLLMTSELVTNAVVHARTEVTLGVAVTDSDVIVTVHDLDLGRQEDRTHDRDGGRGLGIVSALSCECGRTSQGPHGKTAWFRLCLHDHDGVTACR